MNSRRAFAQAIPSSQDFPECELALSPPSLLDLQYISQLESTMLRTPSEVRSVNWPDAREERLWKSNQPPLLIA